MANWNVRECAISEPATQKPTNSARRTAKDAQRKAGGHVCQERWYHGDRERRSRADMILVTSESGAANSGKRFSSRLMPASNCFS
jgi:hypothetical protein